MNTKNLSRMYFDKFSNLKIFPWWRFGFNLEKIFLNILKFFLQNLEDKIEHEEKHNFGQLKRSEWVKAYLELNENNDATGQVKKNYFRAVNSD